MDEEAVWRWSTIFEVEESSSIGVWSEILAMDRVWRMGWLSMALRIVVARRFCGDVVDIVDRCQ